MPYKLNGQSATPYINGSRATVKLDGSIVYQPEPAPVTATPTIVSVSCYTEFSSGMNYLTATIKNNDSSAVTIRNFGVVRGTIAGGATATLNMASGFSVPYQYSISITAQATGKSESAAVTSSGTLYFCELRD